MTSLGWERSIAAPQHQTKAEMAVNILREGIRSGELSPGTRLRLSDLTRELNMSATPIREALRLLQSDGLIVYRPHHGMEVAGISTEAIVDVYRLRLILEPLATELAAPRLTPDDLSVLESLHDELMVASRTGHLRNFGEINGAWHARIYESAGSPILKDIIQRLWERVPWRTLWGIRGWAENSTDDHDRIMEALRNGDAKEASKRMRMHLQSSETWQLSTHETEDDAAEPAWGVETGPAAG